MNAAIPSASQASRPRNGRIPGTWLRGTLVLIGVVALGLSLAAMVLALDSYQTFLATAERIDRGTGVSGSYASTALADSTYRVIRETYVPTQTRTLADDPSQYTDHTVYTDMVVLTPYVMPAEGGYISRIALYVGEVGTGTTQIRVALYNDFEGEPNTLLAQSNPLTTSAAGWLWFNITPQLVVGGDRYWLAYQANIADALLSWRMAGTDGYRFYSWGWGSFRAVFYPGETWGPINRRPCYQIEYGVYPDDLDVTYTVPVTPSLDAYTLTVQAAASREPFTVTADDQAVGTIAYSPVIRDFFYDDMEGGDGGWTADGFSRVVTSSGYYSSPTHAWWTDDVPYGSSASLTSQAISLPFSARNMELRFWHRMLAEMDWDGGWLEYRTRSASGTWSAWTELDNAMFVGKPYNAELLHVPSAPHYAWTWDLTGTIRIRIPDSAAGQAIQWKWVFECDTIGAESEEQPNGWWIDDVRVMGTSSDNTQLTFALPVSLANDGQVSVRFRDGAIDSSPDLLGIDLIRIDGVMYNRAPTVTVVSPNGGEYLSGTQTVRWTGQDVNSDVITYNVYLSTNGGGTWSSSIYQVSYTEGAAPTTRSWTGFNTTAFSDSNNCLIRVQGTDGQAATTDQSNAAFTIDNTAPSVTLTAPNGGEVLRGGASYTITWTASDANFAAQPIALYYSTDGGSSYPNLIIAATENDGSYVWTVPALNSSTIRVRAVATDRAGNSASDASNADLAIDSTAPSVTLVAPNGGEVLSGGATYTITWTASDANFAVQPIALYYSTDGGSSYPNLIIAATENDGSYAWTVPALNSSTVRVRVVTTDRAGNSSSDGSNANLIIDSTAPSVTLTTPNGGEVLSGGTTCTITWTASDANLGSQPIALYYSTDGGSSYINLIIAATENDGSYVWTVPTLDNVTIRVRVAASDRAGNSSSDDSNANLIIDSTAPDGTVTINEGAYAASPDIHLTLSAPSDVTYMYLDGDLVDGANVRQWIAYTASAVVTLAPGDGSKTVTVRYRDIASHVGNLASDLIVYDGTAPGIANLMPAADATVDNGMPTIGATLTDSTSGVNGTTITMTIDGNQVAHTYDPGSGAVSYTPGSALTNAAHSVTLSGTDQAGNRASQTWGFSVNEPPASVSVVASPSSALANGIATVSITATVHSNSGHPVADGTTVSFATTLGTLVGGTVYTTTTTGGVATAVLTSPETAGTATVTATAGVAQGTVDVVFTRFEYYLPVVFRAYTR